MGRFDDEDRRWNRRRKERQVGLYLFLFLLSLILAFLLGRVLQ